MTIPPFFINFLRVTEMITLANAAERIPVVILVGKLL